MPSIDLMYVDVLPPHSGVMADVDLAAQRVRFRAFRDRRWLGKRRSQYSGWFPMSACPIYLEWNAFDWSRR